ncbi:MAG: S1 RNA-binding domain-containing protein, partial [Phycisphaerae bacterium]|nr:S1 RNA-binding domain-containing protein [Phycisphaerae bacterium]MDW8263312.1 S1 RNA-binding domain-containing protein [Phycisphaerales bacterium]
RELRHVKILSLLQNHLGDEFTGVVTGITSFGIYIQISQYLVEGLVRYEHLLDDWWDIDSRAGVVRGQRTGVRIRIGDVVTVAVARVDLPRRELDLVIRKLKTQPAGSPDLAAKSPGKARKPGKNTPPRSGGRRNRGGSGFRDRRR